MVIIGEKEIEKTSKEKGEKSKEQYISVRTREGNDLGTISVNEFIQKLKESIETYQ